MGGEVYISCGTTNSRGLTVLLYPSAAIVMHKAEVDVNGSYAVIDVEFDGYFRCNLVALYGPNEDSHEFFEVLFSKVGVSEERPMVLVGEWNLVMNPDKDTKLYNYIANPRARQLVLDVMNRENLVYVSR